MLSDLSSSSRDDMLRKVIYKKKGIMSCIEVCPNVYGCVAKNFKENLHTIGGQYAKCELLGSSLMFQFVVS